jgi:hypothetical protein
MSQENNRSNEKNEALDIDPNDFDAVMNSMRNSLFSSSAPQLAEPEHQDGVDGHSLRDNKSLLSVLADLNQSMLQMDQCLDENSFAFVSQHSASDAMGPTIVSCDVCEGNLCDIECPNTCCGKCCVNLEFRVPCDFHDRHPQRTRWLVSHLNFLSR